MSKRIITLLAVLSFSIYSFAQKPEPCGSPAYKSEWLKNFQQNPEAFKSLSADPIYVPITIHNVGNDLGQGFYSYKNLMEALCILNEDYAPADIHFFLQEDVRYISNAAFNMHDTVIDGGLFMLQYDIENTINTYFVSDPAGNCGYNLPWASIAMNKSCSGANSHTWAHEVGHHLSLPHPFFGWEGGVSWDNSVPHNFSDPAPTTVLANYTSFKDSLYLDTLIIDTVLVELLDRSNCLEAADGFCDTYPDYISSRWNCNQDGESPTIQKDPNGQTFRSDGTLIMSYSDDICAARFSNDQMSAMRANLMDEKPNLISTATPMESVDVNYSFDAIYPQTDETVNPNNLLFQWEPVENATHYIIQASRLPSFAVTEVEAVTTDNSYLAASLTPGKTFYWRIRPFNFYSTCAGFSAFNTFKTGQATNTFNLNAENKDLKVYPVPANNGQEIWISWEGKSEPVTTTSYQVTDILGKTVLLGTFDLKQNQSVVLPNSSKLESGNYILVLENQSFKTRKKILIQQ